MIAATVGDVLDAAEMVSAFGRAGGNHPLPAGEAELRRRQRRGISCSVDSSPAINGVIAGSAGDHVVAGPAEEDVVAAATVDDVIVAGVGQRWIVVGVDAVGAIGARQRVVARTAEDGNQVVARAGRNRGSQRGDRNGRIEGRIGRQVAEVELVAHVLEVVAVRGHVGFVDADRHRRAVGAERVIPDVGGRSSGHVEVETGADELEGVAGHGQIDTAAIEPYRAAP